MIGWGSSGKTGRRGLFVFYIHHVLNLLNILCFLLLTACHSTSRPPPDARRGVLDLRDWDFERDGSVPLRGEWEFYWNQLLSPDGFDSPASRVDQRFMWLPGSWNLQQPPSARVPGHGFATLRLRVLMPPSNAQTAESTRVSGFSGAPAADRLTGGAEGARDIVPPLLAIRSRDQATAYRLWENGHLLWEVGRVGYSEADYRASYLTRMRPFAQTGRELILVVQVANYLHRNGGLWNPFILGEESQVRAAASWTVSFEMFLTGALCIMGLYHLGLYALRRRDRSNLFFGLLCLIVTLRTVLTGERLLVQVFPDADWTFLLRLEYLTVFLGMPTFVWFTHALFPLRAWRIPHVFQALGVGFAVTCVSASPPFFTSIILYFQVCAFLVYLIMGFRVARGVWQGEESAALFLAGMAVLMVAFVADVLSANEVIKLPFIFPAGLFIFIFVQSFLLSMRFARAFATVELLSEELTRINRALHRFVPAEFLRLLNKESILAVQLGNNTRLSMSVLFSDIRSFTTLSEQMSPDETFLFINAYLKHMVPAISRNRGFIDKYIGDAIMALFPGSPADAVQAAVDMLRFLPTFNAERLERGLPPIRIGIGVNTGPLMLGMVGGMDRMDGTVIGDTVNLASRIEGLTGRYGASLLLAAPTWQSLPRDHGFTIRHVDRVRVKGKDAPVDLYEVLDGEAPEARAGKEATLDDFEAGIRAYFGRDLATASLAFQRCLDRYPEDRIVSIYLERCRSNLDPASSSGWDPIARMDQK